MRTIEGRRHSRKLMMEANYRVRIVAALSTTTRGHTSILPPRCFEQQANRTHMPHRRPEQTTSEAHEHSKQEPG